MKYAPKKVYIKESGNYAELSYTDFCRRREADQRIFELQKTNQQMERLLKKIPPEVLEELQKSNKNRSKERQELNG